MGAGAGCRIIRAVLRPPDRQLMEVCCGLQHAFLRSFLLEDLRCGLWAPEQVAV